jgi:dephospho-CoA kinase
MARRTLKEQIRQLESERDELEKIIAEQQRYDELNSGVQAGNSTKTAFTDVDLLYRRLDTIVNRLEILYGR